MNYLFLILGGAFGFGVVYFLIGQLPSNQATPAQPKAEDRIRWACQVLDVVLPIQADTLRQVYLSRIAESAAVPGSSAAQAEARVRDINAAYEILTQHLNPPAER